MNVTEVQIGNTTFLIRKMDAFAALSIFGDLQRDILPAVGNLLEAYAKESDEGAAPDGLASALREVSSKLDGASLQAWAGRLLLADYISASINGRDAKLTAEVRAMAFEDAGAVLELMMQVIRVNFADFLARWVAHFGPALRQKVEVLVGTEPTSSLS